jgi:hypothetical protein
MAGINFSYTAGEIVDLDKQIASQYIKAGLAEPVEKETAIVKPKETRTRRKKGDE